MPSVVRSARRLLELPWKPGFQAGVAAAQGGQRQDLLQVVEGQPVPAVGEAQPAERLAGRRGRRAGWPGRRRPRGAHRGSALSRGAAGRGRERERATLRAVRKKALAPMLSTVAESTRVQRGPPKGPPKSSAESAARKGRGSANCRACLVMNVSNEGGMQSAK
ncbi:5E5 antigen-like [Chelonia mydas]|uniref:5E5 antigen-like n=1 Tax=Chelonia mydas TaxID=8469 RepID=UPI001CA7B735|nr:5E5 antigen-like [Chelonia mydas]